MLYLGIDIGGTDIKYVLLDKGFNLLKDQKIPTPKQKCDIISSIREIVLSNNPDFVGISIPGIVDTKIGKLITAGALFDLEGINLQDELKLSVPVYIENDAKCAAYAESRLGKGLNRSSVACITIGTGIGGGIIIDDQLIRGYSFSAGEFGMLNFNFSNEGGLPIYGLLQARIEYSKKHELEIDEITGEMALSDPDISERFYKTISRIIHSIIIIINPESILLGGAISADESCFNKIKQYIYEEELSENIKFNIEQCELGNLSGAMGAVLLAEKIIIRS